MTDLVLIVCITGLIHLEALEMLSISCTKKLSTADNKEQEETTLDSLSEKFAQVYISDDGKSSFNKSFQFVKYDL